MAIRTPPFDIECQEARKDFPEIPLMTVENIQSIRDAMAVMTTAETLLKDHPNITSTDISIPNPNAKGEIRLFILRRKDSAGGKRPGVLQMHGGGLCLGTRLFVQRDALNWIEKFDIVVVSVEYRLAPENPHPAPLEDCYAALQHIATPSHAAELGIDHSKILVAGSSAGGNLSAGLALLARDRRGPPILAQILCYPMLDDRMATSSMKQFSKIGTWTLTHNEIAWDFAIGKGKRGSSADDVSIYAAPSRAKDLSGLPPTWIDVGSCDVFRDECVEYASKLYEGGNECELHVWPGGWHGFDSFASGTVLAKDCQEARSRWLGRILTRS